MFWKKLIKESDKDGFINQTDIIIIPKSLKSLQHHKDINFKVEINNKLINQMKIISIEKILKKKLD